MVRNATLPRWIVGSSSRESGRGFFFIVAVVIHFLFSLSNSRAEGVCHYKKSISVEQARRTLPTRVQLGSDAVKDGAGKVNGGELICSDPLFPHTMLHVKK